MKYCSPLGSILESVFDWSVSEQLDRIQSRIEDEKDNDLSEVDLALVAYVESTLENTLPGTFILWIPLWVYTKEIIRSFWRNKIPLLMSMLTWETLRKPSGNSSMFSSRFQGSLIKVFKKCITSIRQQRESFCSCLSQISESSFGVLLNKSSLWMMNNADINSLHQISCWHSPKEFWNFHREMFLGILFCITRWGRLE